MVTETEFTVADLLRRLETVEGKFPKNSRAESGEGHSHRQPPFAAHTRLHAMSNVLDHSGSITSGQHGTLGTGDLHPEYPQLTAVETISGVWTFSAIHKSNPAAVGIVYEAYVAAQANPQIRLATDTGLGYGPGTAPPIISMRRSTGLVAGLGPPTGLTVTPMGATGATTWTYRVTATAGGGETLAATAVTITNGNATLDATNFNEVSWNAVTGATAYKVYRTAAGGTPSTTGVIATTTAVTVDDTGLAGGGQSVPATNTTGIIANAGMEFHRSTAVVPRLFGTRSADTQPQWIWGAATAAGSTSGFALGPGGAVAPDTSMERTAAGIFKVTSHLQPDTVRFPALSAPPNAGFGAVLYCRGALGGFPRLFYQDETHKEIGPLGTLHNILGPPNYLFGQFAVMGQPDDDSAPGLAGVAATGLLANPALVGTATTVPLSWFENGSSLPFFEISTSGALNAVAGLYWPLHTIIQSDPLMSVQFQFGLKDSGTKTSSTTTTVTDTTKAWVVNEYVDGEIRADMGGGLIEVRFIASNTATVITVTVPFTGAPVGAYAIVGPKEANGRLFIGWSDQSLATMVGSDNPAGNYIGLQYSSARARDSGTANAAVTTTNTQLTDTREAWTVDEWTGVLVTCNGKTMTVTSNTATTLTGASWSGGGNPGNGFAWTLTGDTHWQFVSKDGTTQNLVDTGSLITTAVVKIFRMIFDHDVGMEMHVYLPGWDAPTSATILIADPIPIAGTPMRLIAGFQALAASVKKLRIQFINEVSGF